MKEEDLLLPSTGRLGGQCRCNLCLHTCHFHNLHIRNVKSYLLLTPYYNLLITKRKLKIAESLFAPPSTYPCICSSQHNHETHEFQMVQSRNLEAEPTAIAEITARRNSSPRKNASLIKYISRFWILDCQSKP